MKVAAQALFFSSSRGYVTRFLLVGVAYAVTLFLSYQLVPPGSGPSMFWPPAALALALLTLYGLEYWPALLLAYFLMSVLVRGNAPPLAAGIAIANVIEALLAAWLLTRAGFRPIFARVRDSLSLMLSAGVATFVGALLIIGTMFLVNGTSPSSSMFVSLWVGHAVSILALTPFIIRWLCRPLFVKTSHEIIEGIALFGSIATITFLLFWTPYGSIGSISLIYVLMIPLIWAAMRTGPRGMTLALALLGVIGATGIVFGWTLLTPNPNSLFFFQILIGTICVIFMLFSSIVEERKEAVLALEDYVSRLQTLVEKIRKEDSAKTEFLAILAHELRNPLSPILSYLELIKLKGPSVLTEQMVETMDTHIQTVARLLDDLLDVSRISRKKFTLQKERVLLSTIVERSLQTVDAFVRAREHTLTIDLPTKDVWLDADPVRLEQMLVNLLNNAAKYTDPGGTIRLTGSVARDGVVLEIMDNGIGIPQEKLSSIFEPFSSPESSRKPGGLGIGLSLTKNLVELHGGSIYARSEGSGRGTTFEVWLPAGTHNPLATPQTKRFFSMERFVPFSEVQSKRILVVDDNVAAAQGLAALLQHTGHTVDMVHDGMSAIERAGSYNPDVVILDIGLPDIDGYEVARILRGRYGVSLLLIAVTGYGQEEDKQKAHGAGFTFHLTKPVSIADVKSLIAKFSKHN